MIYCISQMINTKGILTWHSC